MKLCLILMCAFSLGVSANTYAQQERVSLKMENVTLKTLLNFIQQCFQGNIFHFQAHTLLLRIGVRRYSQRKCTHQNQA